MARIWWWKNEEKCCKQDDCIHCKQSHCIWMLTLLYSKKSSASFRLHWQCIGRMYWHFSTTLDLFHQNAKTTSMVFTPLLSVFLVFLLNYSPKPKAERWQNHNRISSVNPIFYRPWYRVSQQILYVVLTLQKIQAHPVWDIWGKICDILWKLEESSSILHIVRFLWLWWWLSPVALQSTYASTFGKNRPAAAKSKRGEMRKPSSRQLFNFKGDNIGG